MKHLIIMPVVIMALLSLVLTGCKQQAESFSTVGQGVGVEKLFTADGVTVYRFYDFGSAHYFTSKGETMSTKSCGKSCSRQENIGGQDNE